MNGRTLVLRSLRFHWRSHLGVLLGAILSTAILVGALAVGDSVRYSLERLALSRLGDVHLALNGRSRFFRQELASDLASELKAPAAAVVLLRGTAVAEGGAERAGRVQVVGVTDEFWKLGGGRPLLSGPEEVVLNQRLAEKLGATAGDEVLLRVDRPSLLSRDAPLSTVEDATVPLRLKVAAVAGDGEFGRFGLEANQVPPFNAFVPIRLLQEKTDLAGRANVVLVGAPQGTAKAGTQKEATARLGEANAALWKRWQLADAALDLRELPKTRQIELKTDRVFIDAPVGEAALKAAPGAEGILTYFVNGLRVGDRSTPYSTVAALEGPLVPDAMSDDEIVINSWLAEDLRAKPGDSLSLEYYVVGSRRQLEKRSRAFRVRSIVPLSGAAADPDLMPEFPGVADTENCRDWKPGIPVDLDRIRDKDEVYWDAHRGTPKAFVTLRAGQSMWNSRFGNLTAVRYPMGGLSREAVEVCVRQALNPASIGLFFTPVREQALAASSQSLDFGQLFLGFSFFLIVAALLLMALLFAFGVEQRAEEVGVLLALGFQPRSVRRLLLLEGAALALVAGIIGGFLGIFYTQAVVRGLSTVWRGAVANSVLYYHAEPATLAGGAAAGFLVALFAIWLVARKQAQAPARELLASGAESESGVFSGKPGGRPMAGWVAVVSLLAAAGTGAAAAGAGPAHAAEYFFGAGSLLLIAGLAACRVLFGRMERGVATQGLTLGSLGVRNSVRRRGRSLSAIGLLACGSFLVVSVGASRHDPNAHAHERSSGTGGFALYAEATLPVYHDLNRQDGRDVFGLEEEELQGVQFVPFRLREGDEASCLNLNRAQTPRLLGVDPAALRDVNAFTFASTDRVRKGESPWTSLARPYSDGAIPAIGDTNTVVWSLGKGVGQTLEIQDDQGRTLKLRIVGILANSVLQGSLVLSEENFVRHFPNSSGYQVFLIDAPAERAAEVSRTLSRTMEDVGFDVAPAAARLADFNTVENTYLSIFAALGGLGLLLGSVGLGVIVLRNVLERRGELGLLRAVGFRARALQWLVFSEHSLLLALGLVIGVAAAVIAVLPALLSPGAEVPTGSLALTLGAVLLSGFAWTWAATAFALRGPLMNALRNE